MRVELGLGFEVRAREGSTGIFRRIVISLMHSELGFRVDG